ncbi:MAG TPA: hypothetical protein VK002_07135 [Rubricoccaceae bacterium]|nr:hypothetical protein [Rubricoccaceae bacterium]
MPRPSYPVARLMWAAPLLLFAIAAGLLWAGVQQREAAERGAEVRAEVVSLNLRERAEITRGSVRLRYTPPAASAPVERDVELPMSFLKELEGREGEAIPIRVLAGSDQIVLGEHPRATWVLTFAFAAMALLGGAGLTWMVAAWNRFLNRHGDPSEVRVG